MTHESLGAIHYDGRTSDYLFRTSMKSLIVNPEGNILVVKESGRDWWDLPGGGMEHGETIHDCIARELHEEVLLKGPFKYETLLVEDAQLLQRKDIWQIRLTFVVRPRDMTFSPGDEGDEVAFMEPSYFSQSNIATDKKIYEYWQLANQRGMI